MASSHLSPPLSEHLAVPKYDVSDPLLGNLSPDSTLQALSNTDAVPKNEKAAHDILSRSIAQASPAERALGIRAAVAAQKLGQWYREVQKWEWPKRADAHLGKGFVPPPDSENAGYYGSLPASVVDEYEKRIEEIRDGMESLDVEELKEHVLNAHIPGRSRPSSAHSTISVPPPLSYVQLSDFTAVITATILRALPLLSRLNSLLSTWDVRLLVLRQIPGLLQSLRFARSELNAALGLLKSSEPPTTQDVLYSITNYHAKRVALESNVLLAGRKMDRILDSLDGREDSLPEHWIDDLESTEADFAGWVMQAEKRTVENEWRRLSTRPQENGSRPLIEAAQPVLDKVENTKDIATKTRDTSPEPLPPTRLAPIQVGRSLPMETIAEEISSPLEPPTRPAGDMTELCTVVVETELPESRSTLPADTVLPKDDTVATLQSSTPSPVQQSALLESSEDASPLLPDIASGNSEAMLPPPDIASHVMEPVHPEVSEDAPRDLSDDAAENYETRIPQTQMDSPSEELATLPELREEEAPAKLTKTPTCPSNEDIARPLDDITSGDGLDEPAPADKPEPAGLMNNSVESVSVDVPEQTPSQFEAEDESVHAIPMQLKADLSESASEKPSLPEKVSLREQDDTQLASPKAAIEPPSTENCDTSLVNTKPPNASEGSEPLAEVDNGLQPLVTEDHIPGAVLETRSSTPERCVTPPNDAVASLPNLFKPIDNKSPAEQRQPEESDQEEKHTPKKPLDSPIKLSKTRPGRLDLDKHNSKPRRRTSNGSDGSLSDYPSLVSSPEIPEPRTSSSNGTPLLLETPPNFPTDYRAAPVRRNDHTLREDRLIRLDAQKSSPRGALTHNRALSLPLQRFINERIEMNYESGSSEDTTEGLDFAKKAPLTRRQKSKSATTPADIRRLDHPHLATTREESTGPDSDTSTRLKKRLTAQPSRESIGPYKSNGFTEGSSANALPSGPNSRQSSPVKRLLRPKDHMDEKINSILTTLPGRIHLVQADQDDDAVSVASSLPFRGERFRSHSPQGTPARSYTPTSSLGVRPASRRRYSHAPEESSVKLYHLHRGGKSAPTKLFVRTVGENGERVMVRVGGGWADLAEYLREYAIHHGRRHVSETPRVEVEGLSSRESPSYSPPGSRVPSGSGRYVPARPRSVLSNRPASSLAVRKTRRSSNVSDMADFRTSSAGDALNVSFSPMTSAFTGRRLSVSSNVSAGAMSSVSEMRHGSPSAGGASPAMPLGLAGPKPRAKHATISPESEAWVEDVLGQARRSSSLRPFKLGIQTPEAESEGHTPTLPKARSISDIGKAGSSKRVALRGLR
ncbi:hypothetical protein BJX63DRAFT_422192 [Aspergillus granulosus]|uniref:GAR domain-containing protein n=1 Tax=Aspergillus granulosus TaxID=176169 RepID=A0ABR4H8M7_9EURO